MRSFGVTPLLIYLGFLIFSAAGQTTISPVASTTSGPLRGIARDGVHAFLSIPFAEPPVGALRFLPPQPPMPWTSVRDASQLPPPCPQRGDDNTVIGSEDCLYLNVWAPENAVRAPVLFFIHGGGNLAGSTSVQVGGESLYDGTALAREQGVVVVTIQYRVGALGYLVHPSLDSRDGLSGNYGILDQLLALDWVQANIPAFGGDPARVLLFGESAGAVNTCVLLASPMAANRFSAALMQSGSCLAKTHAAASKEGIEYAAKLACESADCLRQASVGQLVEAQGDGGLGNDGSVELLFGPVVDQRVLRDLPLEVIRRGEHNHVPFVIGANADETGGFVLPLSASAYRAFILKSFGPRVGQLVLRQYAVEKYDSPREALVAVTTDSQFVCPSRAIAREVAQAQSLPVYRYFFTRTPPGTGSRGAFHGLELWYIFQHYTANSNPPPQPADLTLQEAIGEFWTNLAAQGDPNGATTVGWPRYIPAVDSYLELGTSIQPGYRVRAEQCDFWEQMKDLTALR